MTIKISEMTPDASIGGGELIPVSDAGSPKSVTISGIKSFVVDQIEAIAAGTAVTGADGVFILQGGVLKPVDIDLVAQYAIDTVWGKTAETVADGADLLALKDGGTTEKTVTLAILAEYVRSAIEAAVLDISNLAAATTLASSDVLLVTSGTTGKKVAFSVVTEALYAGLVTHVTGKAAVSSPSDTDVFYVIQGGVACKVTLATLKTVMGSAIAPDSTTEDYVPQWSSAAKTLKDGLSVKTTLRDAATAEDTAVVTEKAVRTALDGAITFPKGDANGVVAMRIGAASDEGLETFVVDTTVSLAVSENYVSIFTIPSGVILRSIQANIQEAGSSGGTYCKIGLGIDADPDLYGKTAYLTQNQKIDTLLDYNKLAGEVALKAFACASDGSLGNSNFYAGSLRVRIVYDRLASLLSV